MRVPFYDIKAQYDELQREMDKVVHEVVSGGAYIMGPHHRAFEMECADIHRVKHAIAVNSGTDALRIIMDAMGIGPGDEVITTAFTFVASTETIVQTGANPVFVDIDCETFCIDPSKIEAAITPRTKAIMPIHLFGQLSNVQAIDAIARAHNLEVIEDAAQAFGCSFDGKPAGNFGAAGAFSFYVTKNLGACGDGGMIVTNDDEIAETCKSLRIHGMGRERYYYDHVGYTSRLSELNAAFMRVKLKALPEWNERRAKMAAIYNESLADSGIQIPVTRPGNNNTWHQYSILVENRDELQAWLKSRDVDSMIYYPVPLHFHEPYRGFGKGQGSLPVTERVSNQILNLPIHPHLKEDQIRFAAESIAEFAREKGVPARV
jgi:dTDP-4-amino-4,6-dideoxygalactose transaminase